MEETPKASPFWYAMGALIGCPIVGTVCLFFAAVLILGWPFWVVFCYLQRRREVRDTSLNNLQPQVCTVVQNKEKNE